MGQRAILWAGLLSLAIITPALLSAPPQAADEAAERAEPAKPRGRLPNHYGKLGVTDAQRERIYSIQAEYDGQIDDLLAQIEQLRTQRNEAVETLLTPQQLEQLAMERQLARKKTKQNAAEDK